MLIPCTVTVTHPFTMHICFPCVQLQVQVYTVLERSLDKLLCDSDTSRSKEAYLGVLVVSTPSTFQLNKLNFWHDASSSQRWEKDSWQCQ